MKRIEVMILNPEAIKTAEKMMVCAARLTQRGQDIHNMADFIELYNQPYTEKTVANMVNLPHPTIQKFAAINVAIVGASRRYLAQITRHQNEVKFMSASLQYGDYSGKSEFAIPYEIIGTDQESGYLAQCQASMQKYMTMINAGVDNDAAGYIAPQGLRNVLIMSATPYQWKHMIHQRTCRRNTPETRYLLLKIWEQLYNENPILFGNCGPFCMNDKCEEGRMGCGNPLTSGMTPTDILKADFPKLCV